MSHSVGRAPHPPRVWKEDHSPPFIFLIMEPFTYSCWVLADLYPSFCGKLTCLILSELPEKQGVLITEWDPLFPTEKHFQVTDSGELAGVPAAGMFFQFAGESSKQINFLRSNKCTFHFDTKCTIWDNLLKSQGLFKNLDGWCPLGK